MCLKIVNCIKRNEEEKERYSMNGFGRLKLARVSGVYCYLSDAFSQSVEEVA